MLRFFATSGLARNLFFGGRVVVILIAVLKPDTSHGLWLDLLKAEKIICNGSIDTTTTGNIGHESENAQISEDQRQG